MYGFPTIGPILGVLFTLAGLALAVVLGLTLYPDKKKLTSASKKSFRFQEEGEVA